MIICICFRSEPLYFWGLLDIWCCPTSASDHWTLFYTNCTLQCNLLPFWQLILQWTLSIMTQQVLSLPLRQLNEITRGNVKTVSFAGWFVPPLLLTFKKCIYLVVLAVWVKMIELSGTIVSRSNKGHDIIDKATS